MIQIGAFRLFVDIVPMQQPVETVSTQRIHSQLGVRNLQGIKRVGLFHGFEYEQTLIPTSQPQYTAFNITCKISAILR
jgi:hypothetical protein